MSVSKSSAYDLFQLAVSNVRVKARAECAKMAYSMGVQNAQARVCCTAPNVGCNKPCGTLNDGQTIYPTLVQLWTTQLLGK